MPTGIEEFLGAVAAFIAQNAALSALSGNPDPNGAIEAGESAHFAPSPMLETSLLEGSAASTAVAEAPGDGAAGGSGSSQAPVDGDRPPPGTVYERPAIHDGQRGIEYIFTDPEVIIVGPDPADSVATDSPAAAATEPPPGPSSGPTREPNTAPQGADAGNVYQPPLWLPPPPMPMLGADLTPPALPTAPTNIGVPADWADAWERGHEYSWSKLLFDRSGEETYRDARQYVNDRLGDFIDWAPAGHEPPEAERSDRALVAGAVQTTFDIGFGLFVLPVLDPSSIVRGILRTGVASAIGAEEIQQGQTLDGSMKILGEVSAVVLTVATPVRAMTAKGPPPAAGEASVTIYLQPIGKGEGAVTQAHNAVQVVTTAANPKGKGSGGTRTFTEAVREMSEIELVSATEARGGDVVAAVRTRPWDQAAFDTRQAGYGGRIESFTRAVSPEMARRAAALADSAGGMNYKNVSGGISEFAGTPKEMAARVLDLGGQRVGPFSAVGEHCSTYAAAIARAGGVTVAGRFGPHVTYLMFKYGGATGLGSGLAGTAAAAGMSGNAGGGATAPP